LRREGRDEEHIGRIVDSGASHHITSDRDLFTGVVRKCTVPVSGIEGGEGLVAVGVGSGRIVIDGLDVVLDRLYFVPGCAQTLISVSALVDAGHRVVAELVGGQNCMSVHVRGVGVAVMSAVGGLYEVPVEMVSGQRAMWEEDWEHDDLPDGMRGCAMMKGVQVGNTHVGDLDVGALFHQRFGHVSSGNSIFAGRLDQAYGPQVAKGCKMAGCPACLAAKMRALLRRAAPHRPATRPLERVAFDLSPKLPVRSANGDVGFMLLVDEATRKYFFRAFKSKSEVLPILKRFKVEVEAHFGETMGVLETPHRLSGIRSDGEQCNVSTAVREWCEAEHITHELSAPYFQHQNGLSERGIQTVWQGSEAQRKHAGAPPAMWKASARAFVHVRERLALGEEPRSPYELWNDIDVPMAERLKHVRVWGCKAYAYVPKELRGKFGDHCRVCVMIGYSDRSKAYELLDLATGAKIVTPSAIFDETSFPFADGTVRSSLVQVPAEIEEQMLALFGDGDDEGPRADDSVSVVVDSDEAARGSGLGQDRDEGADLDRWLGQVDDDVDGLASPVDSSPVDPPVRELRGVRREVCADAHRQAKAGAVAAAIAAGRRDQPAPSHRQSYVVRGSTDREVVRLRRIVPVPDEVDSGGSVLLGEDLLSSEDGGCGGRGEFEVAGSSQDVVRLRRVPPGDPVSADTPVVVALKARLLAVPVRTLPLESVDVRMTGQVDVPRVDPMSAQRLRIFRQIEAGGLSAGTIRRLGSRIQLIAMAAKSSQLSAKPPSNHFEALSGVNGRDWREAMEAELGAMSDFGVWKLEPRPPGAKAIGCRWIFCIKRDKLGDIKRLKARLVAKGYAQVAGRDFVEGGTWAPTCRMRVFRALMAEAASESFRTVQWDATSAFLHAEIDVEMYMAQPPGFDDGSGAVCKLLRCLYGLRQSGARFAEKVRDTLLSLPGKIEGCSVLQSHADECLYTVRRGSALVRILVFVDDFSVTTNDDTLYDAVFAEMGAVFKMTDYDGAELSHYLGIAVSRSGRDIHLSQEAYIDELIERLDLTGCKGASSPEAPGTKAKLARRDGPLTHAEAEFMASVPYKSAVGALFYVARATRPDIVHGVGQVARFMEHPAPEHWNAVLRIYRYLSRTKDRPLVMRGECGGVCEGYSDSDWAGDPATSKSHSGWLVFAGGSPVAWSSKAQTCIAQSSCEAEYVAAASLSNELVWWRQLREDMGLADTGPLTIHCDNQSAGVLAQHSGKFEATKHILLKYHVLRSRQADGEVVVRWCPASAQVADLLTKNAQVGHFLKMATLILGSSVV
jgi:hypothetical protein